MFYDIFKAVVLVLCMHDSFQASTTLYTTLIGPIVLPHIQNAEDQIEKLRRDSDINIVLNRIETTLNSAGSPRSSPRAPMTPLVGMNVTDSGVVDLPESPRLVGEGLRRRVGDDGGDTDVE